MIVPIAYSRHRIAFRDKSVGRMTEEKHKRLFVSCWIMGLSWKGKVLLRDSSWFLHPNNCEGETVKFVENEHPFQISWTSVVFIHVFSHMASRFNATTSSAYSAFAWIISLDGADACTTTLGVTSGVLSTFCLLLSLLFVLLKLNDRHLRGDKS